MKFLNFISAYIGFGGILSILTHAYLNNNSSFFLHTKPDAQNLLDKLIKIEFFIWT